MKMSRLFPIVVTLALFLVSNDLVYGQKKAETGLPVVYNDVSQGATKLDADAKKIYGGKFRVRDVTNKDGFSRSQIKGREMDIADPRGAREREKPVKVVCLFIVNADGQPIEPRIVSSTDSWASETMIKSFATRRFVPAKLNGLPVASLNSSEIKWGGEAARDHPSFENGLGIMGYRDR